MTARCRLGTRPAPAARSDSGLLRPAPAGAPGPGDEPSPPVGHRSPAPARAGTWGLCGLLLGLLLATPACAPVLVEGGAAHGTVPLDQRCASARTEADYAALSRWMTTWHDGELQLHALSPSAIEELTNAPIRRDPEALVWSYRFTAAPARPGVAPAPPLDHDGYPRSIKPLGGPTSTTRFISLRVITRERVHVTPHYLHLSEPQDRLVEGSFSPRRLLYRGLFATGHTMSEYSDETRARGLALLYPGPADDGGAERVEITLRGYLPGAAYRRNSDSRRPGSCSATVRLRLPLPAGGPLWDRLNRAFLAAPLHVRDGKLVAQAAGSADAASPTAAAGSAAAGSAAAACDAGESEGCYSAAQTLLAPPAPAAAARTSASRTPAAARASFAQKLAPARASSAQKLAPAAPPTPAQVQQARDLYAQGCALGHGPSCGAHGMMLRAGTPPDPAGAQAAFRRACDLDFGEGCSALAAESADKGNETTAARRYALGCRLGSGVACYEQARRAEGSADDKTLWALYRKGCVFGVVQACVRFSDVGRRIKDSAYDFSHPEEGYDLACGVGLGSACNQLGVLLREKHPPTDSPDDRYYRAQAAKAFARACALGDQEGCRNQAESRPSQPPRSAP